MTKKNILTIFAFATSMVLVLGCTKSAKSAEKSNKEDKGFELSGDVEWVVTSSPGGGSSIFTQNIVDIIKKYSLLGSRNITINYQTDGGGAIGRRRVSQTKSAGQTVLTFNSGDLLPFVTLEKSDLDELTPLAVMATDTQVFLVSKDSELKTIEDILASVEAGNRLIVGGSKGDDETVFQQFKDAFDTQGSIDYIRADSTGEALTQILGGHIDMVIAKPAASFDYVSNGDLLPVVTLGEKSLAAPFDVPTFTSLGHPQIKFEIYRGIVGPKDMAAGQVTFWDQIFKQVVDTPEWKDGYIKKFYLNPAYKSAADSLPYMQSFEDAFTNS